MMIASGSIHAVVNAIVKGGRDEMAARAVTDGSSALMLLPATLLVLMPAGAWSWLAASAAAHAVYLCALARAYSMADLSAAYPVLRGTALLVTVGLFGEPASVGQLLGIALIGAAMLALVAGRHLSRPRRARLVGADRADHRDLYDHRRAGRPRGAIGGEMYRLDRAAHGGGGGILAGAALILLG